MCRMGQFAVWKVTLSLTGFRGISGPNHASSLLAWGGGPGRTYTDHGPHRIRRDYGEAKSANDIPGAKGKVFQCQSCASQKPLN